MIIYLPTLHKIINERLWHHPLKQDKSESLKFKTIRKAPILNILGIRIWDLFRIFPHKLIVPNISYFSPLLNFSRLVLY